MTASNSPGRMLGYFGAVWGIAGIAALLAYAAWRLAGVAAAAWNHDFYLYHWLVLAAHVAFMARSEGYRGFQQSFSPRIVARAKHLIAHPRPAHVLLAPLFCMGYFHTSRRRMTSVYVLTVFIITLIIAVRWLAQPWRGIVDAGVVVGLLWGLISMAAFTLRALTDPRYPYGPEVPGT